MASAGAATVSRRTTAATLVAVAAAGIGSFVAVGLRDPHVAGSWGTCPVLALTGVYCPGCGGLRAANDLLHADLLAAASSNVVAVAVVALAAVAWVATALALVQRRRVPWERVVTGRTATLAVTALLVFSVVRNTPLGAALAP